MKFDFDDILIQPAAISRIESRKQVDVFYEDGYLPLFTAPMDTVIDDRNYTLFQSAGIKVVRPRKRDAAADVLPVVVCFSLEGEAERFDG